MEITFEDNRYVEFREIKDGDLFLINDNLFVKVPETKKVESEITYDFNAVSVGCECLNPYKMLDEDIMVIKVSNITVE